MNKERTERLPMLADPELFQRLLKNVEPLDVTVQELKKLSVDVAVSIIDNFDQLQAAFLVLRFRIEAQDEDSYAKKLVKKADENNIRGTLGVTYARDRVYQETGFFAGI